MIFVPVAEKPDDKTPRGKLRGLLDWLVGGAAPRNPWPALAVATPPPGTLPTRIGTYTVVRKLGQRGMGIVYAARDERLDRTVALKTMSSPAQDETARRRFWREA